jgi:phage protein D
VTSRLPISRVAFDGMPYSITPLSCNIYQSVGQHEQVEIKMTPVQGMTLENGAYKTLSFTWDVNSAGRFYGYITDYSVGSRGNTTGTVVSVTAMGVSFVMKTGRPRFFTNATVADAAARIVSEAQLGFVDEFGKDHYVWPQLAQTDESDWEFINDLAKREGSQLLVTDGVVRLIDPRSVLQRTEPVLLLSNSMDQTPQDVAGLFDLTATAYSNRLPNTYTPTVAFLNDGKVQTVQGSTGMHQYQQYYSGTQPLRNQTEAELAQINLPVDWSHKAEARVTGSAKLQPGAVTVVHSGLQAANKQPYDGFWYITDAQHVLATQSFQTKLSLARIASGSRRNNADPAKNWWADPRGRPTLVLNNVGNWISTWR